MPAPPRIDPTPVRADDIKSRWRRGESPDAAAILQAHPSLARHKSVVVDLAYEEYCLREEAGDAPDAERFCERFGAFRGSIRKVLDAHRLLADHPELLGAAPVEWPTAGATVEGLELVRELGRGAFGRAYLAFDPETNRPCVLKLAAGRSAEARVVGPLDHPNVTDVYWSRPAGGLTAVCMPLVGVTTLEDVRDAAFPTPGAAVPPRANVILDTIEPVGRADATPVIRPGEPYAVGVAAIAVGIADALRYLHARGVAHGDLKPSNVVLGVGGRPHLIDFNLAITKDAPRAAAGGTLPYMAPEQLRVLAGQAPSETIVPERADLYAFGVMLFELLTGRLPCDPAGPDEPCAVAADLLARRLREPCDERSFPPETPARLVRVVLHCLAPDPAARPANANVVATELTALLRAIRRRGRRWHVAIAACGAVALAGASWFALPEDPPAAPVAQVEAEPTTADEFFARGLHYLHAGQYPQALSDFTSAKETKRDAKSLAYLAYSLALTGQQKKAAEQGIQATQEGASSAAIYNNIGYSLRRMAQYDQAVSFLDLAIKHDPNLRDAYYNRAYARHEINVRKSKAALDLRAVQDIRKVLQYGVVPPDVYCLAANIYAHAAVHDPALCDQAIAYIAEAIRRGTPARNIQRDVVFKRSMGNNPKFRQVLATPQETKGQIDSRFGLVEPVLP